MKPLSGRNGARPRAAAALALLSLTGALAACGSSEDDSAKADAAPSTSASTPAKADNKKKVKLAVELTLTGVKFAQDTKAGMDAFAKEDGAIDLETQGPPSIDPVTAQKQASDMLATSPDGFGISPFPPELWQRTIKDIKAKIPNSIAYNIKPVGKVGDAGSSPLKTFVGVDDTESARQALTKTIELAKLTPDATGEILLGQCVAGNTGVLYERIQGFKEVAAKLLPKAKVTVFDSKVEPQANTVTWTSELAAHPKPLLAIGTCDQDSTSLYKVKKAKGYTFPAGALETPPEAIKGIEDGTILASVAVNWYLEGYVAAKLLADGARGTQPPEGFVDVGSTLITKDNVAEIKQRDSSPAETAAWYAPKIKALFGDLDANVHPLEDAWK
jgi:ABC-type sugar transport system substrate-binding protein